MLCRRFVLRWNLLKHSFYLIGILVVSLWLYQLVKWIYPLPVLFCILFLSERITLTVPCTYINKGKSKETVLHCLFSYRIWLDKCKYTWRCLDDDLIHQQYTSFHHRNVVCSFWWKNNAMHADISLQEYLQHICIIDFNQNDNGWKMCLACLRYRTGILLHGQNLPRTWCVWGESQEGKCKVCMASFYMTLHLETVPTSVWKTFISELLNSELSPLRHRIILFTLNEEGKAFVWTKGYNVNRPLTQIA